MEINECNWNNEVTDEGNTKKGHIYVVKFVPLLSLFILSFLLSVNWVYVIFLNKQCH